MGGAVAWCLHVLNNVKAEQQCLQHSSSLFGALAHAISKGNLLAVNFSALQKVGRAR